MCVVITSRMGQALVSFFKRMHDTIEYYCLYTRLLLIVTNGEKKKQSALAKSNPSGPKRLFNYMASLLHVLTIVILSQ